MVTTKARGFTLIELMIASSLLLAVMFSGYYAYSLFSSKWEKRTDSFWESTQHALAFDSMNRVITSTYPYIVNSDKKQPAMYYQASTKHVLFVTHSALFSPRLAVVELAFESSKNGLMLIYKESSLDNQLLLNQSDIIEWQHQVILLDNLKEGSFSFFGWQSLSQIMKNIQADELDPDNAQIIPATWYHEHFMENIRVLPNQIRVYLLTQNQEESDFSIMLPEHVYQVLVRYLREEN